MGKAFSERAWPRAVLVAALLYLFLVGVKALETGIGLAGEGFTERLFEGVEHPLAGLCVGILATVLVQSSSVTTATIVGLVGAGSLSVEAAVPMVMGANIGTTVTNTLASLGYLRRSAEFGRAFAGATMHDFFNLAAVAILLPVEIMTGFIGRTSTDLANWLRGAGTTGIDKPDSPVKELIKLPVDGLQNLVDALGGNAHVASVVMLVAALVAIFTALAFITRNMRALLVDRIERSVNRMLARGAGIPAMGLGLLITVAVQSSSITTSVMVPLIAAGVLSLRNAYPVTLGANLGTTVTALLASLATDLPAGLAIALAHSMFNLIGILILYPVPALRDVPLRLAEAIARLATVRKSIVLLYVLGGFVVVPLIGLLLLQ
ncbi:MAG TPA: Na/Pi symporter [Acidimicrobiia bacterium]|nr:Na/Pi symporter [Acidimicrobiia bacterium]